ncbi:uncharacterized protein LOC110455482 [Mizuhopecten yessoensis]|uniref:Uncharacterized protein n=1 Tax=Mizuhopecten yessoensis TaxID=6573 RepID=A0A210QD26_MIZYE|nr:uncharacterized protein LOC110455482 [Mizuhopecten yessoensis]OWF46630.1 hypothetical protein KP79_PYT12269 [Mizuhopecten yessoensis]
MDFLPLALVVGALAFCTGEESYFSLDERDIEYGPYYGSGDGDSYPHGYVPPSTQDCEHLYIDTKPMQCSDFITSIPRSSAFLYFVHAAHYLLYTDDYYFLMWELQQIPISEEVPEPDLTSRECRTQSKRLLGYWRDYGELCWIVWAGRQNVQCANCLNDYCCREFNSTDGISLLPPTSRCRPSGHTVQKFIVFCAYLFGDPYYGYFYQHYTYLPSCCECKTDICKAKSSNHKFA